MTRTYKNLLFQLIPEWQKAFMRQAAHLREL